MASFIFKFSETDKFSGWKLEANSQSSVVTRDLANFKH